MGENKNTISLNEFRGMIKLNGKPLKPLTAEDMRKQAEYIVKCKKEKEERLAKEREKLYKLIDGQVHKISENRPMNEFSVSDFSYDWEYDVDICYYDYKSYFVTVYLNGDKSNSIIARYCDSNVSSVESINWKSEKDYYPIGENDCWEYTKEAFEKGLKDSD